MVGRGLTIVGLVEKPQGAWRARLGPLSGLHVALPAPLLPLVELSIELRVERKALRNQVAVSFYGWSPQRVA